MCKIRGHGEVFSIKSPEQAEIIEKLLKVLERMNLSPIELGEFILPLAVLGEGIELDGMDRLRFQYPVDGGTSRFPSFVTLTVMTGAKIQRATVVGVLCIKEEGSAVNCFLDKTSLISFPPIGIIISDGGSFVTPRFSGWPFGYEFVISRPKDRVSTKCTVVDVPMIAQTGKFWLRFSFQPSANRPSLSFSSESLLEKKEMEWSDYERSTYETLREMVKDGRLCVTTINAAGEEVQPGEVFWTNSWLRSLVVPSKNLRRPVHPVSGSTNTGETTRLNPAQGLLPIGKEAMSGVGSGRESSVPQSPANGIAAPASVPSTNPATSEAAPKLNTGDTIRLKLVTSTGDNPNVTGVTSGQKADHHTPSQAQETGTMAQQVTRAIQELTETCKGQFLSVESKPDGTGYVIDTKPENLSRLLRLELREIREFIELIGVLPEKQYLFVECNVVVVPEDLSGKGGGLALLPSFLGKSKFQKPQEVILDGGEGRKIVFIGEARLFSKKATRLAITNCSFRGRVFTIGIGNISGCYFANECIMTGCTARESTFYDRAIVKDSYVQDSDFLSPEIHITGATVVRCNFREKKVVVVVRNDGRLIEPYILNKHTGTTVEGVQVTIVPELYNRQSSGASGIVSCSVDIPVGTNAWRRYTFKNVPLKDYLANWTEGFTLYSGGQISPEISETLIKMQKLGHLRIQPVSGT